MFGFPSLDIFLGIYILYRYIISKILKIKAKADYLYLKHL